MQKTEKFHSATIPDSKLLQGILGLRGIAAFAVVLFHIRHLAGIHVPEEFNFIERDFGYGAQLFFVLSAFSLMYSTEHTMHRPDWAREYLIKRFFRIAPLFYIVLAYTLTSHAELPGISTILLNVFFVFGFVPDSAISLVMAGWTIGVEMIFYALFPVLLMAIKSKKEALIFVLMAILISYVSRFVLHTQYLNMTPRPKFDWSYFTFLPNLYFFAVGIFAYRVEQAYLKSGKSLPIVVPIFSLITISVLLFTEWSNPLKNAGRLDLVVWAFSFGALCIWQSIKPSYLCANRFFEYFGERSFSIYLLHPLVIVLSKNYVVSLYTLQSIGGKYAFFVLALVFWIEILIIAEVTYRFVEVPGIKLGRKIIGMMRGATPSA